MPHRYILPLWKEDGFVSVNALNSSRRGEKLYTRSWWWVLLGMYPYSLVTSILSPIVLWKLCVLNFSSRRRKYPSDSTAWFIRFFRNLDQHFHDQTDEGLLCLKTSLSSENNDLTDADFLDVVRSSSLKQREVIGKYITTVFPNFFLSVWLKVGSLEF